MRSKVVAQAKAWLGCNEADGTHKKIIDVYNAHTPLARGYKVKYTDAWCATFVSAVAIQAGVTAILPIECGCGEMVKLFQKKGCWVEDDTYTPSAGDVIFYDWEDSGKGDNTAWPDHVGIVEKVTAKRITVIEGNYSNSVKRRYIDVNAKLVRGFGVPKYTEEAKEDKTEVKTEVKTEAKKSTDDAQEFNKAVAGTYEVTASLLNVRHGAGTDKKIMCVIPDGTKVKNYGYYTTVNGVKWLYVQFTYNGVTYTGFASSKHLYKK